MEWFITRLQPTQHAVLILVVIVTLTLVWLKLNQGPVDAKGHPRPPGPTPLPLFGSALSINMQQPWLTYTAWRDKYGDVMYARLLDTDVILLNSRSDAVELLEKRSQIYSDRPFLATLKPYGFSFSLVFAQYGPLWRFGRRIMHQTLRAERALAFRPAQLRLARQMVVHIIDDPNEYPIHFATFSAAVGMFVVYGYEPEPRSDPLVEIVDDLCRVCVPVATPEKAVLLKAFPFLLSVPEWIPGLSYIRREASKSTTLALKAINIPYQSVLQRMEAKEDIPDSMVRDHIQRMVKMDGSQRAEYELALKHASSTTFTAASETTSSALMNFALAMVKHPRVWKQAQAEIDAAVGTDRLPEFEDRTFLPYVEAVVRESLRWIPVAPLAIPHAVTSSDIYKGYYIPAGATVIANVWAMSRDETQYPDPEAFIPERFLNSDGTLKDDDPADFVFGFGRRRCAGVPTADASVWSSVATMLATLDFNAVKDENGDDIEFEAKFVNGVTLHPVHFPCNLTPRAHISRDMFRRSATK